MNFTCPVLQIDEVGIACSLESLVTNPAGLTITPGGRRRKRRSLQGRDVPLTMNGIVRSVRQTTAENVTFVSL